MHEALFSQMRELEDKHWWFLGRRRIVEAVIGRLRLKPGTRILDAGCGTGGNLPMLQQFGQVTGAEYDPQAAEIARKRQVAEIIQAGLPDELPFEKDQFHLVTLLDVLEHIDDDHASLVALGQLIRPGGYLVLTVPAYKFLWGEHDIEHHHKRRYRAAELRSQLQNAGMQLQWLSYYNSWLFPFVAAVRLLRKLKPLTKERSAVGRELELPPAPINWFLKSLFASERHWLGKVPVPFGVSLIAVARKP
ncbi:MAG: methyltransferase domain-containing protein [Gammaproteobacteria bacterium]|jgi:SAM-dependent methyltransferase|nr:methyltransferase domain-containing protein [Gammaproteobacteria bacterium]